VSERGPGRPSARDSGSALLLDAHNPSPGEVDFTRFARAQKGDALLLSELSPTSASPLLKRDASRCETLISIRSTAAFDVRAVHLCIFACSSCFHDLALLDHLNQLSSTSECRMPDASELASILFRRIA
jgi:hypothetical protein